MSENRPAGSGGHADNGHADYGDIRADERFDSGRLAEYLRSRLPDAAGNLEVAQFRGGHSNLTYLLRIGGREWVMRRPPHGPLPPGGHDMAREYRVLSRLADAYDPAPRALLICDDPAVIGAPFFIMERRSGIVLRKREPIPLGWGIDNQGHNTTNPDDPVNGGCLLPLGSDRERVGCSFVS